MSTQAEQPAQGVVGASPMRQLARSGLAVATGTALSRVTGFLRVAALAAIGFARLSDVYNVANSTPNIVYELLLGGILTASLVPLFVDYHERGDDRSTDAVNTFSIVALLTISALGVIFAPLIASIYSSRLTGSDAAAQQQLMIDLLRMLMPQIFFYGVTALFTAMLNARRKFAAAAFAPSINNIVVIAVLLTLPLLQDGRETVGSVLANRNEEWLLGLGTTLGVVAMTVILLPALRSAGVRLHWVWEWRHPAVRQIVRLSGWTVGYVIANQLAFWVVLVLSYRTSGDTSAYLAAFMFFQLPHGIFTVSIMTVVGPELARASNAGDLTAFRRRFASGLRVIALVVIPAGALMIVLAKPIVRGALDYGNFSESSVVTTSSTLALFGIGLFAFSAYLYTIRAMYSRLDTRTPFLLNVLENTLNIVLAVALYPSLGVKGLALSWSISYSIAAIAAWAILDRRLGGLEGKRTATVMMRIVLSSALGAVAAWLILNYLDPSTPLAAIATVLLAGVVGGGVGIGGAAALGVPEIADLRATLTRSAPSIDTTSA
ncbi:MAG: murein biosynthesis integral membrane protein MurJ [Actinobacteria bacterium]|nr:murein biosynthesis integral membrane protein MurJ [Actinomycetota bacterium]